jgi:hypothetical protein
MSDQFTEVKLFGAPRCNLAESPRWAEGHWWWVDAKQGIVYWRPGGAIDELENLPISKKVFNVRTSMVQPIGDSRFVVAVANTLKYFEFKSSLLFI